tara:strand:- start:1450 stop:1776 length:327 start_codon:yes stop_codon:yes gene_type:complete
MPRVGDTHFAYTPAGKLKAEAYAQKTGQKVTHAKKGKWIQAATKKMKKKGTVGALRKEMGAKPGKPIPKGKLKAAAKGKGLKAQRARFALNVHPDKSKKKKTKKTKKA